MKRCPIHDVRFSGIASLFEHVECVFSWIRGGINAAEVYANQVHS